MGVLIKLDLVAISPAEITIDLKINRLVLDEHKKERRAKIDIENTFIYSFESVPAIRLA